MTDPRALARSGQCPSCGAPVEFPFASALAQVCGHCRFVVVRTDRGFQVSGKVAELLPIRSKLGLGGTGSFEGQRFRVAGRVQYERVQGSAPWQEFFLELGSGQWVWVAEAQGRTYVTALWPPGGPLPPYSASALGTRVNPPGAPSLALSEWGERRLVAAAGELPFPIRPGQIERYGDLSGADGAFGTIDYGDGGAPPLLFVGRQIEPAMIRVDPGAPGSDAPAVTTTALECPSCGGNLPLLAPGQAERIVCRYCGMQSDLNQGALVALQKVPLPEVPPDIPIGAKGRLRDKDVICVGMLERSTVVEDESFTWREYLLYAGPAGYLWLVHDEGAWQLVEPAAAGDVRAGGGEVSFRGSTFHLTQQIQAKVERVVGEFYWKVAAGATAQITDYEGRSGAKLASEIEPGEINWSLSTPIRAKELREVFPPLRLQDRHDRRRSWYLSSAVLFALWGGIAGVSCATSPGQTLLYQRVSAPPAVAAESDDPLAPDGAYFSSPFQVPQGRHRMDVTLRAPELQNSWVASALALVNEDTGDVYEANVEIEYYSGVSGGESWSEGSRDGTVTFTSLTPGRYVARVESEFEPGKTPLEMTLKVERGPFRLAPMLVSLAGLVGVFFWGRAHAR